HGHTDAVLGVACSPNGKLLASASEDGTVRLWEVANGKELRRLHGHGKAAWTVAFSPDGTRLASGGIGEKEATVLVWDGATGKEVAALRVAWGFAGLGVAFSPGGKWLAAGVGKWSARVWDVAQKREVVLLKGQPGDNEELPEGAPALAFTPDGQRLVTGDSD